MRGDGLKKCSVNCIKNKKLCDKTDCRLWINFPIEYNCCLVSIYENGNMTLRQVGERIGTVALKKMKRNALLDD